MPRVSYVRKADDGSNLIRVIDMQRFLYGKKDADVCDEVNAGVNFMTSRRKNPMSFKIGELLKLTKCLKFEVRIYDGKMEVKSL